MNTTTIIVIAVIVVIALLFLFLVRGRKQRVTFGDSVAPARPAAPAAPSAAPIPAADPQPEGHGVGVEMADAIEDVVDQFMGLNSHPTSGATAKAAAGDTLTLLKGLGPKAASLLNELGVTRFDQIAAWDDGDIAAIDAQMGAFKGRIERDRWVDQARLLAKGDTEAFEAAYGKLGG